MPLFKCLLRPSDLENSRKQVWHWYNPPMLSVVRKMNEIQWCCRLYNKRKMFSYNDLLGCFHTFFLVSVRYPLFHCWRFLRHTLGFTKVCWTKFYATTLTAFSRYAFSEFASQCSTQSFYEVAYLCITCPVFARFLRYWQVNVFRNIFTCRFPSHACFASFIKMTKCVYVIRVCVCVCVCVRVCVCVY